MYKTTIKWIKENKALFIMVGSFFLIFFLFDKSGNSALTENGELLASNAITSTSPWCIEQGIKDFFLVVPMGKLIIFFSNLFNNPLVGVIAVILLVRIILKLIAYPKEVNDKKIELINKHIKNNDKDLQHLGYLRIALNAVKNIEQVEDMVNIEDEGTRYFLKQYDEFETMDEKRSAIQRDIEEYEVKTEENKKELYKKNKIVNKNQYLSFILEIIAVFTIYNAVLRTQIVYDYSFYNIALSVKISEGMRMSLQYAVLLIIMMAAEFLSQNISGILDLKEKKELTLGEKITKKVMRIFNTIILVLLAFATYHFPAVLTLYLTITSIVSVVKTIIERRNFAKIQIVT